jgi:very-short-patch-repair endonuclease
MVERGLAGDLLPAAMSGQVMFRELAPAFLRAFYTKWLAKVVQEREELARFSTLTHEERVNEFRRLDERVLKENRAALVEQLRDRIQHRLQQPDAAAQLPYLRREMARQRMQVFSSMRGDEINAAATTSHGARLLRAFLLYAERGRIESISVSLAAETESPFERDVFHALTRRNMQVLPQVGVAGYRIDLGVLDDVMPGRFLCGIECDGLAYHASETARDRDRLRQQVLEARGWTIHRVWSTDWFKDRQGQIERLLHLIEETRARARETEARAADEAKSAHLLVERQVQEKATTTLDGGDHPYERPIASRYMITPGEGQYTGSDLLVAPFGQLAQAVTTVVETESPIHMADMLSRVAGMWGTRARSRIQARISDACQAVERDGRIQRRGDFFWSAVSGGRCSFRSRSGIRIPGDRIAPEEYREVLFAVLSTGYAFSRAQLTNEVRAVLGFSRTGAILDEAIGSAITLLLQEGKLGETSTGLRLRS